MSALEPVGRPADDLVVFLPDGEDLDLDDGLERPAPSKEGRSRSVVLERIPAGPKCNGIRHDGNGYCRQPMGWHTPHTGVGRCVLHGGMSPQSMKAAAKIMAAQECETLGLPVGTSDPIQAMRTALAVADGMVDLIGRRLARINDPLVEDHLGDLQRHAMEVMLQSWNDQLARIATSMARLGLAERELVFRESEVSEVAGLMLAVLDDPAFGLSHAMRQRGREVLGRHLRRLGPVGASSAVVAPSREVES